MNGRAVCARPHVLGAAALAVLAGIACRASETRALVLFDVTVDLTQAPPPFVSLRVSSPTGAIVVPDISWGDGGGGPIGVFVAHPTGTFTLVVDAIAASGCSVGRGSVTVPSGVLAGKEVNAGTLTISKLAQPDCPGGGGGTSGHAGSGGGGAGTGGRGTGGAGAGGSAMTGTGGRAATGGAAGGSGGAGGGSSGGAVLSGATAHDFGPSEVGTATAPFNWTVTNTGGSPTGTLQIDDSDPAQVTVAGTCTSLAAGKSCTLAVTVKPATAGQQLAATVTVHDGGASVTLNVSATPQYRVTVTVQGTGTVTSVPAGIACGSTCTALFSPGLVTLQARPTNGSGYRFSAWTGAVCGPERDCVPNLASPLSLTVTFEAVTSNLVFITSQKVASTEGSAAAYDAECNTAATAAGINNAAGNGYVAYLSDATTPASARVPATVKGWIRMDGKPFATMPALFSKNQVFYPVAFTERGEVADNFVRTGTDPSGAAAATCSSWTSTIDPQGATAGYTLGGPGAWTAGDVFSCPSALPVICMGTTGQAAPPLPVPPAGAKKMWLTNTPYLLGAQTPDAKCNAERPAGVTSAVALISKVGVPAANLVSAATTYVRPDGAVVGTGADIAAGEGLQSGIWQSADGTYVAASFGSDVGVWTGSRLPSVAASASASCSNWTSATVGATGTSSIGNPSVVYNANWWTWTPVGQQVCDSTTYFLYCLQTAP